MALKIDLQFEICNDLEIIQSFYLLKSIPDYCQIDNYDVSNCPSLIYNYEEIKSYQFQTK